METVRKFIIAELSIRKLESSSVLHWLFSTDEDPSLRIESSAIINLRAVSTKLYFNLIFTMQTYKDVINVEHFFKYQQDFKCWTGSQSNIISLSYIVLSVFRERSCCFN